MMALNLLTSAAQPVDFESIKQLVEQESKAVDSLIIDQLSSDVILINQMGHYIVNNGGKRLRPMLLLLVAKALGKVSPDHITLAAVIEFIHTATLLHDDVVDESDLRRGRESANAVWGNAASVLVGDYLYSSAFEMMVSTNNMSVMEILSKTTTAIAEGEVLQLLNCNNPETTEQKYLEVISRKTAILFSAATRLAGVISRVDPRLEKKLSEYGQHLGIAFQLIDDALDYKADKDQLGKNLGDDLAEGKPTLPLIYAIKNSSQTDARIVIEAIKNGNRDVFNQVYDIVKASKAIEYTEQRAYEEAEKAMASIDALPENGYKSALNALASFSVQRTY